MFTTDNRAENFLTGLGVRWNYRNGIRLPDDFAPGWNTRNLGRPKAIVDEAVAEYAAQMLAGSAAPAPILVETPEGLEALDGIQRLSAAVVRQMTCVSAYVVETDDELTLTTIRVLANPKMQGRAEKMEWTQRRAVEALIVDKGMTCAQVAVQSGWKPAYLRRLADAIIVQRRVYAAGGPELSDAMLTLLRPLIEENTVLEAASKPAVGFLHSLKKSRITAEESEPFMKAFFAPLERGSNPYKKYMERLEEFHNDADIKAKLTGRQSTEIPRGMRLLKALKAADTISEEILLHGEGVTNPDEYHRIMNRVEKNIIAAAKKGKRK